MKQSNVYENLKTTLSALRSDFQGVANECLDVVLILAWLVDRESRERHDWRLNSQTESASLLGGDQEIRSWRSSGVEGTEEWEKVILVGSSKGVKRFEALGKCAGACLPIEMRPSHPFHDRSSSEGLSKPLHDLCDWTTYVFETLMETASPSITFEDDWPKSGCRIAQMDIDPFQASSLTIDRAIAQAKQIKALNKKNPNQARDKWLYDQYSKGTPLKQIVTALKDRPQWNRISSEAGIGQAAQRYAKENRLPVPRRHNHF